MIPDGTSPEAIVLAVIGAALAFSLLTVGYFWYRSPELFAWIARLFVKHSEGGAPNIMSRSLNGDRHVAAVPPVPVPGTQLRAAEIVSNLTEEQIVEVLALVRNARGKYLYSGKKIYALVGGNYGVFLAKMRTLRGDDKDELPEEPTILTPIAGRPTKASYYQDTDLEYQSPPH